MAVTVKSPIFWDVTQSDEYLNGISKKQDENKIFWSESCSSPQSIEAHPDIPPPNMWLLPFISSLTQFTHSLALQSSSNHYQQIDRSAFFSVIWLFLPCIHSQQPYISLYHPAITVWLFPSSRLLSRTYVPTPCPIHCSQMPLHLQTSLLNTAVATSPFSF